MSFLPPLDVGKVKGGFHNAVKTAHVGDHRCRVDLAASHHGNNLYHIVDIAARIAGNMCGIVMDIIEIKFGRKLGLGGACEEVEASVVAEDCAALLHNRLYGSENENIIKSLAAGKAAEHAHGIVAGGVYIVKLNAEFLGILRSVYGCGAGKSCIVNIGDNQK